MFLVTVHMSTSPQKQMQKVNYKNIFLIFPQLETEKGAAAQPVSVSSRIWKMWRYVANKLAVSLYTDNFCLSYTSAKWLCKTCRWWMVNGCMGFFIAVTGRSIGVLVTQVKHLFFFLHITLRLLSPLLPLCRLTQSTNSSSDCRKQKQLNLNDTKRQSRLFMETDRKGTHVIAHNRTFACKYPMSHDQENRKSCSSKQMRLRRNMASHEHTQALAWTGARCHNYFVIFSVNTLF